MLIHEIAKRCNITKKAVQYYVEQGLLSPGILKNGYREFTEEDASILKKIVLYRQLNLSISEIKIVLENPGKIKGILHQRTLELEKEKIKQAFENIDKFVEENKDTLDAYYQMKQTEEFKQTPGYFREEVS